MSNPKITPETKETVMCYELNRLVLVSEAVIITRGNRSNFIICKEACNRITEPKRSYPCSPTDKEGFDIYALSFYHGAVARGTFLFSIGKHSQIYLPQVEAALFER